MRFHAARQLARHLLARRQPAPDWLTPPEAVLFDAMPPADQVEGLRVVETLRGWGSGGDRSLLVAGLLHDVGKSLAPAGPHLRVLMTCIEALPRGMQALFRRQGSLAILADHAGAGAEMAESAGLGDDVAGLIRRHHQPPSDARDRALQQADALH